MQLEPLMEEGELQDWVLTPAAELPAPAVVVGELIGFHDDGAPLVDFPNPYGKPLPARTTTTLTGAQIGAAVTLLFEGGAHHAPIITGVIQPTNAQATAEIDAQRTLNLTAQDKITLRCGDASITLTKAGKILIRGAHVLSRATGVNKVKGAAVRIN